MYSERATIIAATLARFKAGPKSSVCDEQHRITASPATPPLSPLLSPPSYPVPSVLRGTLYYYNRSKSKSAASPFRTVCGGAPAWCTPRARRRRRQRQTVSNSRYGSPVPLMARRRRRRLAPGAESLLHT